MLPRNRKQRVFDPTKPVYARRKIDSRGWYFGMGEEIPWKKVGISLGTMQRWFRLRMISHFAGGDQSVEAKEHYAQTGV